MAKRAKKEKDQWDLVLDQIDFKGLTQDEVLGQDGLVKQLTGRLLQGVLEAEMDGIWVTRSTTTVGIIRGTAGTGTAKRPCSPRTRK